VVGTAFAKRWQSRQQDFDYGDKHGVKPRTIIAHVEEV